MKKMGFKELVPYTHNNRLVRWIFLRRLDTMLKLAGNYKNAERVLDFGAGSGIFTPSLSEYFKEVYALDINIAALEYVKRKYKLKNVTTSASGGGKLPYRDGFFDVIFAADALEHFPDSYQMQKELKRVLKNGGYLIISGPTENFVYVLCRKIFYKQKKPPDHYTDIKNVRERTKALFKIDKVKILPNALIRGFEIYRAVKSV
jgi:ubiquinone/menaquinone biosynthesis C-methylase UbiE